MTKGDEAYKMAVEVLENAPEPFKTAGDIVIKRGNAYREAYLDTAAVAEVLRRKI